MISLEQISPLMVRDRHVKSLIGGKLLLLKTFELKDEIAAERQNIDQLHNLCDQTDKNNADIRKKIRERRIHHLSERVKEIRNIYEAIEELQILYDDLQESTEIFSLDTSLMEAKNSELKRDISEIKNKGSSTMKVCSTSPTSRRKLKRKIR